MAHGNKTRHGENKFFFKYYCSYIVYSIEVSFFARSHASNVVAESTVDFSRQWLQLRRLHKSGVRFSGKGQSSPHVFFFYFVLLQKRRRRLGELQTAIFDAHVKWVQRPHHVGDGHGVECGRNIKILQLHRCRRHSRQEPTSCNNSTYTRLGKWQMEIEQKIADPTFRYD